MFSPQMLIKFKAAEVEQSLTTFWKDERYGYNGYQNEQDTICWPIPPYPLGSQKLPFLSIFKPNIVNTFFWFYSAPGKSILRRLLKHFYIANATMLDRGKFIIKVDTIFAFAYQQRFNIDMSGYKT